ncbi:unnamed protein product, partial [Polarella glacialis]
YQNFDTWSWHERAIELEWYTLSQRLGTMLACFEAAPVIGALLFRSGLTGFASRVPLFVGFALAFATDFTRQKVPIFERKLCEIQVNAIMDGEVMQINSWWKSGDQSSGTSAAQLATTMALGLILLLPYILGLAHAKIRSSLFSCWLGVGFMLAVQLTSVSWRTPRHVKTGHPLRKDSEAKTAYEDLDESERPAEDIKRSGWRMQRRLKYWRRRESGTEPD